MAFYIYVSVLCLLIISVENRIIKSFDLNVPPEGVSLEINIRQISPKHTYGKYEPKVTTKLFDMAKFNMEKVLREPVTPTSILEHRHGILVGKCPAGHKPVGTVCMPDNDY